MTYYYVHLGLQALERYVNSCQPLPDFMECVDGGLGYGWGMPTLRIRPEPVVLVPHHAQQGSSEVVGLELRHGLEALHENLKVAAILLELPPAEHLHQR